MLSPMWIILLIISFVESGIAITLNTYIVITYVKSIKNGQRLNPSHLIHLAMGLVNIILQCSVIVQGAIYGICVPILFIKEVYLSVIIFKLTMIYCSFWLTAWLCAYYCTSITNFRYGLCDWLKRISSTFQVLLLVLLAAGSFLLSLLCIWNTKVKIEVKSSQNSTLGASFISGKFNFNYIYVLLATFLGCFLPLTFILYSIVLTFSSLIRHVCKIKQNDSGFTRPKLQAHINAIRTLILLVILFVIFGIAEIVLFTRNVSSSPDDTVLISWFIIMSHPTAESIIVIQANSKLKKILLEKFSSVFWRNVKTEN